MLLLSFTIVFLLVLVLLLVAILKKKMQYWIVSDLKRSIIRFFQPKPKGAIHVMFAIVDHFEPGNGNAAPEEQKTRVDAWVERYPKLAVKHKDSDGICPQHTFFFPPHYDTHNHLEKIVKLCSQGFGEVEMHLHHDRQEPWPDNEISLRKKILDCVRAYSRYGVFCLPDGKRKYGFIHGDWALANSVKGGEHCGVNDELSILKETGCYADFTFPTSTEAQPRMANTIFYGQSCSLYPKGYNKSAIPVKSGVKGTKGLMLIQGIIGLRFRSSIHFIKPSIEQSNLSFSDLPFPARIDYWVRKNIHVKGKPNWIFVKIHCHGASAENPNREMLLNNHSNQMFAFLEEKYNDLEKFFLHYVSAREMYNIVKAAECGKEGNPNKYRDYFIPRYSYLPHREQNPKD